MKIFSQYSCNFYLKNTLSGLNYHNVITKLSVKQKNIKQKRLDHYGSATQQDHQAPSPQGLPRPLQSPRGSSYQERSQTQVSYLRTNASPSVTDGLLLYTDHTL